MKGNELTGAEALVRMLDAYEVRHVFGLCGDTSLPFYDAMRNMKHGMNHVLTRDERTAAYMADGYSRVTGKPGVCEGPSGGGATYILPGLIEANESSSAVLGITSDISVSSYGRYPLTEVDQQSLMRPLTKWNTVIARGDHIPRMMRQAFRTMTTGRPGAAHLGIPYDIMKETVDPDDIWADRSHCSYPAWPAAPDPSAVERALKHVLSARQPVFICGGGVVIANAMAELDRLATRLDIPVITSISGQGSLSDFHPNCLGVVGSNGGTDETWELVQTCDLIVFLGCRAGSTTTSRWEAPDRTKRIVQIDCDPDAIGANYRVDAAIAADLRLALEAMNSALDFSETPLPEFGGAERVRSLRKRKFTYLDRASECDGSEIHPGKVVSTLQSCLDDDPIIVSDPGTSCPFLSAFYRQKSAGRRFITNRAHGALGYALGAAVGAWFGCPERRVVAVMGDGSFGFTCGELETVVRYQAPVKIIVLSNSSFGWIKASQHDEYGARYHNVDFVAVDHAAIAADYGVRSWRADSPRLLNSVIGDALAHEGPALVDIICKPLERANAPVRRWMG